MVVCRRLDIKGPVLVFITTTVHRWTPIFKDPVVAELVVRQLAQAVRYFDVSLVGYVLMPSHLHMLLGLKEIELSSRFMQSFKILASKAIKASGRYDSSFCRDDRFRLWRPRFDELVIESEKQFRRKLNYIHNNPVKAGLVSDAADWKYSSAGLWLNDCPGLLPIDRNFSWT